MSFIILLFSFISLEFILHDLLKNLTGLHLHILSINMLNPFGQDL